MLKKKKTKNQIILGSFAAAFSVVVLAGLIADKHIATVMAAQDEETKVMENVLDVQLEEALGEDDLSSEAVTEAIEVADTSETENSSTAVSVDEDTTQDFSLTVYDSPVVLYASDTVNVRSGAGTDYDKLGRISWGTELSVL